jgi:hypothetical protein
MASNNSAPEVDNSKEESRWGGKRPGAGRRKGSANRTTLERAAVLQAFRDRVAKNADQLLNAQMSLAVGTALLFRVDKDDKGKSLPAVQVTDPNEIKGYIDGDVDQDTYYFITTKLPDNKAIDSLLDRTFGKAEGKLDVTSAGEVIKTVTVVDLKGDDKSQ